MKKLIYVLLLSLFGLANAAKINVVNNTGEDLNLYYSTVDPGKGHLRNFSNMYKLFKKIKKTKTTPVLIDVYKEFAITAPSTNSTVRGSVRSGAIYDGKTYTISISAANKLVVTVT